MTMTMTITITTTVIKNKRSKRTGAGSGVIPGRRQATTMGEARPRRSWRRSRRSRWSRRSCLRPAPARHLSPDLQAGRSGASVKAFYRSFTNHDCSGTASRATPPGRRRANAGFELATDGIQCINTRAPLCAHARTDVYTLTHPLDRADRGGGRGDARSDCDLKGRGT